MTGSFALCSGLGVGMATSSPPIGMQYVDPTPIATHTVPPEAMEGTNQAPVVDRVDGVIHQINHHPVDN